MLRVNETLKFKERTYRILHLMPEDAVWICLDGASAFPALVPKKELHEALESGALTRAEDPHASLIMLSPEPGSTAQIKRDRNYALIRSIVDDPLFYDPKARGAAINRIVETGESTKRSLYTLIRRYWQRGQSPNALIPDYKNSGGKGKKRKAGNKLGRPRVNSPGVGAIVDEQTERLFRIAIDTYLLKDTGCNFPYAHRRFKDRYENLFPGTPESEMPTKWQMHHFYKREYGQVEQLQKRTSRIEYNKDVKPLTGTAGTDVAGPGSRFEIDATIADIYLVSDSDRHNIVGRPVIYMVIDVFSRMVAGLYIGFESPSYAAAIQALAVAMTDKVAWCKQHGFDISPEQWPVAGLPDAILADRGELLGSQIEALENSFSVRIENAPPYRGDAKGIVERSFRTIQAEFKPFAPGVVGQTLVKKRGGKDYRLDAKLTIRDFREIIISSILMHNQYDVMEKYDRTIDMPDDLPATPLALWNWGVQNRTGRLRAAPEDALRISLLPRTKATISDLGVSVFGLYYTSQEIVKKGWLHRAKEVRRPAGLQAAYDPATADCIYLFPEKDHITFWKCQLASRSREFSGCSFWDVWQAKARQKETAVKARVIADVKRREHERFVEDKIAAAQKLAPAAAGTASTARIRDIRKNKAEAVHEERRTPLLQSGAPSKGKPAKILPLRESTVEDYGFPSFIDELYDEEKED